MLNAYSMETERHEESPFFLPLPIDIYHLGLRAAHAKDLNRKTKTKKKRKDPASLAQDVNSPLVVKNIYKNK